MSTSHPSTVYSSIRAIAEEFVHATDFSSAQGESLSSARVLALRAPNCQQSWGHKLFISTRPMLARTIDNEAFLAHLQAVFPSLDNVTSEVHDVFVDEHRRTATVLLSYFITPKGTDEAVENDMVWLLEMDEAGKKVVKAVEYLDAVASGRLAELMGGMKAMAEGNEKTKTS